MWVEAWGGLERQQDQGLKVQSTQGIVGNLKKIYQAEDMELMLRGHFGVTVRRTLKDQLNHHGFILRVFRRIRSFVNVRVV